MENQTQTYYHFTQKDNVFSIIREGLKPGEDGFVYLCTSIEDCVKFVRLYWKTLAINSPTAEIAFIPVELDPADVEEIHDHDEQFVRCKAYKYNKTIPPEKIPFLDKITLYEFEAETAKTREDKARKQLAKQGYTLKKSRAQTYTADNQGGYMITQDGVIQAGERFDMTLEDVEKFVAE